MFGYYVYIAFILILSIQAKHTVYRHLNEHDKCPPTDSYPESYCELAENCPQLQHYVNQHIISLNEVPSCDFKDDKHAELFCCPKYLPEQHKEVYPYLAFLGYLKPPTLDEIVYRCTALVLSSNHLLATTNCFGSEIIDNPLQAVFGVHDARDYFTGKHQLELRGVEKPPVLRNDLVIYELDTSIEAAAFSFNVSRANICAAQHLRDAVELRAIAYAQNNNAENCALFKQKLRLLPFKECSRVQNIRQVEQIKRKTHICLMPIEIGAKLGPCTNCLIPSSSVLEAELQDGSVCVAGIATPTTADCVANMAPLYYTSIMSKSARDYFDNIFLEFQSAQTV
ncbi:uncharacterized protein LOC108605411 [Drosophila busckii]|uniref:uncharacterized protein LOC108605411 n=1 Tax=Drosophila busckii TaxID=30019 RepID=UPI00083EC295|nr:uncharacterized protein LOC108605411 [Drosophila busckii]